MSARISPPTTRARSRRLRPEHCRACLHLPECHAYLYLGLYNEHHRDQLRKVTDAIHAAGGKAAVQIWHGGFVPEEFFDKTNKLETA